MTITRSNSGTVTADGTEQTLASPTAQGKYRLLVDLVNLVNGDIVELRVKVPALNGGTARTVYYAVYQNAQSADALMAISPELPVVDASTFTLKQTAGTNRDYPWAVVLDSDVASSVTGAVGSVASGGITSGSFAAGAINAAAVADGAIDAATFAAGAITATVIATGAIDADALAADAVAEIADGVWDEDATGHQTQGTFGQAIGDPGADADTIWGLANTNLDATMSSRASQASVNTIDDFLDTEIAGIISTLGTPAGASISADIAVIEGQTDDIGVAGAGLTALPWNAVWDAEVQSEVTDALVAASLDKLVIVSGTADSGSTTTMVDAARTETDNDYWKGRVILFTSGDISGQCAIITDFVAATDTFTFAPPLTQAVATQTYVILPGISVWDDTLTDHLIVGSTGSALNAAGAAGDPWSTALPGAYGAGTAGKIVGDNINATISSRASQTSLDTLDDFVDTEVAAIKAKTDQLTFTTANQVDSNALSMANGVITAAVIATDAIDADAIADNAINAGAIAANAITSAKIATDAIGAAQLAADAVAEIQSGLSTLTAAQVWDLAGGIETGLTPRQAMRLIAAATAGKLSGAATVTVTIRNAVADDANRIVATVDADGNRTAIAYSLG